MVPSAVRRAAYMRCVHSLGLPRLEFKYVADVTMSFGAGRFQRPERFQRRRWRAPGAVRGKHHRAVAETLQRLAQPLASGVAAAAQVGEVDSEHDHLAATDGTVEQLAAGSAAHRAADTKLAGEIGRAHV